MVPLQPSVEASCRGNLGRPRGTTWRGPFGKGCASGSLPYYPRAHRCLLVWSWPGLRDSRRLSSSEPSAGSACSWAHPMTESRPTDSRGAMVQTRLPSRYRVIEEVGQGGMAVVYRAHDEALKREVAVKLLHPHLLAEPESKIRLEREAQAVAKLHHDNIVQIFDYSGSEAPSSYIVTEFIDGQTLKQFMGNRRPPPPEIAALVAIEIGSALLARAHLRHHPPRRQTRQRHGQQRGHAQADGLRGGADHGPRADDRDRSAAGIAGLHGPRVARGPAARRAHRCLFGRHPAVSAGHRRAAVFGTQPARGAQAHRRRKIRRPAHAQPPDRRSAGQDHRARAGAQARRSLSQDGRAGRRPGRLRRTTRAWNRRATRSASYFINPDSYEKTVDPAHDRRPGRQRQTRARDQTHGAGAGAVEPRAGDGPQQPGGPGRAEAGRWPATPAARAAGGGLGRGAGRQWLFHPAPGRRQRHSPSAASWRPRLASPWSSRARRRPAGAVGHAGNVAAVARTDEPRRRAHRGGARGQPAVRRPAGHAVRRDGGAGQAAHGSGTRPARPGPHPAGGKAHVQAGAHAAARRISRSTGSRAASGDPTTTRSSST